LDAALVLMPSVTCPFCHVASAVPPDEGLRRRGCEACGKAYWVQWAAPVVSTVEPEVHRTEPIDASGVTHVDLGAGVPAERPMNQLAVEAMVTVVGSGKGLQKPPPDFAIEDEVTDKRPVAKPLRASPAAKARAPVPAAGTVEAAHPGLHLGGLTLLARIGGGGMGTVWLARQVSLDRNVAVKILKPSLGDDPAFVIQFTREALAAAQLVHHHIAQIHDIGFDHGLHYFSMEYVDGESLSALVKREGRLDPEVAAGYVLQAARGLKFAHDRGLIHRDVKPENLLLNRDGIVKVADLGLVKRLEHRVDDAQAPRPNSTVTDLDFVSGDVVMGTPAYMAPEQLTNAKAVDGRTDLYALGCTLYECLVGHPPFEGETTAQVLTMHLHQAPPPPEQRNHRVPPALSAIVVKMMAKNPNQRFADMGALITALERFLGIEAGVAFSPKEEHADLLERSVEAFNASRWAARRRIAQFAFVATSLAVVGIALTLGFGEFAAWASAFIVTSAATSVFVNGVVNRSALLLRVRHLALGAPLWTWAVGFALLGVGAGLLAWFEQLRAVLEVLALAAGVGLASYLLLDRRVARDRRPHVAAVEEMLKGMRLRGLEEQLLRQFVCRYSGAHWEAFYEALFGYDAKLQARARWGRDEKGAPRRRFGAWRDPFIRFIDERLARRRQAREAQQLEDPQRTGRRPVLAGKRPRGG
jgi:hypothetical protein